MDVFSNRPYFAKQFMSPAPLRKDCTQQVRISKAKLSLLGRELN